jgi:aminopeptidase YwaD
MGLRLALPLLFLAGAPVAAEDKAPLLTAAETEALAGEISGAGAKRTIVALSLHHRMRGSTGYNDAAALIAAKLKDYGLAEVETIRLPADGRIFYGTQRSRPAWNAKFAELWEQKEEGGRWQDRVRIASFADQPISLAQDSTSGRAEAELVDIGAGTAADLRGKDVRGKLVLTSSQPEAVAKAAVTEGGAAGIVSWAQNQRSAWWGEDQSLVRWGHLSTWSDPAFAFMVSPGQARAWQARLAKGETVRLRAAVEAGRTAGEYRIPTAVIPGKDRSKEIVFSCHLDHPSPGANDNASGCSGILEVARSLNRLISDGRLPKPERSIRFIWPCEIECTIALLNARPEFARRALATIHLDMIGGNTEITKGNLKVEGSPPSLPSFVSDVGFSIARWVDDQASLYADTGAAPLALTDPEGTKQPLRARIGGFTEGSDHQVWAEGSWRIPVIYIADWPDIFIHTNKDVPGNIDATKLKRAIFIAASSAWALASLAQSDGRALDRVIDREGMFRGAEEMRRQNVKSEATEISTDYGSEFSTAIIKSFERFGLKSPGYPITEVPAGEAWVFKATPDQSPVYRRNPKLKGPMNGFGYSWLDDHLNKAGLARPALLAREPAWEGPSFGYEALNLVNGERSVQRIADELSATVGPAPVEEVAAYLGTLERLGVVEKVKH